MRLLRYSLESCIHNKKKAILNLMICLVTVILVNVFAGNIISIRNQLDRMPEAIKIKATISNLNGSMDSGLKIREEYLDGVLASKNITNAAFSVQLLFGFGEFGEDDARGKLNYYASGCNNVAAIPGMLENEITYEAGMNSNEFFNSTQRICILDKTLLDDNKLSVGDEIMLTNFYYRFGDYEDDKIFIDPMETGKFTIVGTMNIKDFLGNGVQPDILYPFKTIRNIYHEKGYKFYADSGSFQVKDPFKLNELKDEMHKIGFLPPNFRSEPHYDGNALTIKDDTFVRSAEQLIKSRDLMMGILPFLGVAVLCIGFVVAQLLMKSRISEYAIMRSLGQSHKESFTMLVLEYGMSALAGSVIGILVSLIALNSFISVAALSAAVFFICYIIGTMAALSSLRKLSIMSVLSKND